VTRPTAGPGREPEPSIRIRPYLQAATSVPRELEPGTGGAAADGEQPLAAPAQGLRPFVLTSGRVDSVDPAINLETQVTARPQWSSWTSPPLARLAPELQAIVMLCAEPTSVAEISARLRLHLGVTKILVGDLRATGHLDVHIVDIKDTHDPDLIMRVIHGLRAIA
jgi:hypothetical protein